MNDFEVYQYELINSNIIFVDGLTRVGKSAVNQLVSGIKGVSHPQVFELIEQICPMVQAGLMTIEAASALLRLNLNERAYNYELSRNLNFREKDLTSVYNAQNTDQIIKNLNREDGDNVLASCTATIHQFQTHDLMSNYRILRSFDLPFKIIEVYRNPIDTIRSWQQRGWGKRFDNADLRSFTTLFKVGDKVVPHYIRGLEIDYLECNELEKCVVMHNHLIRRSIAEYQSLTESERRSVLLICFEDVMSEPDEVVSKIANFLGSQPLKHIARYLKIAAVPRVLDKELQRQNRDIVFGGIRNEIRRQLEEVEGMYLEHRYFQKKS